MISNLVNRIVASPTRGNVETNSGIGRRFRSRSANPKKTEKENVKKSDKEIREPMENLKITEVNPISKARFADEPEYRMTHSKRGIGLIINNKRFDPRLDMPLREGTDKDAASLESTLSMLGFEVRTLHNCSSLLMRKKLLELARADHTDMDCFLCCILTHGEDGVVFGVDEPVDLDQLIQPFKLNRTLAGKPKLFFIQACRGSNFIEGIDSNPFDIQYVSKIPMEADFLIAYSTIAGCFSWRNSINGSWFIQSLCHVLNKQGKTSEIMQILTAVNRRVAFYYESNTNEAVSTGKRQIPCILSMLTKELYFKPKLPRPQSICI